MKILIADDSMIIRESLSKLITRNNPEDIISKAVNVGDAIRKIKEIEPDLVILDLAMPGGDGFDVMKEIRKRGKETVVIMLTNYATENNRRKSLEAKVDFFLDKTNEFEKVIEIIKQRISNGGIIQNAGVVGTASV
ncbi:MAG: response regulator transcription factor [Ignavibacteriaceae bacterium]